jgi:hypothetical protein
MRKGKEFQVQSVCLSPSQLVTGPLMYLFYSTDNERMLIYALYFRGNIWGGGGPIGDTFEPI